MENRKMCLEVARMKVCDLCQLLLVQGKLLHTTVFPSRSLNVFQNLANI